MKNVSAKKIVILGDKSARTPSACRVAILCLEEQNEPQENILPLRRNKFLHSWLNTVDPSSWPSGFPFIPYTAEAPPD